MCNQKLKKKERNQQKIFFCVFPFLPFFFYYFSLFFSLLRCVCNANQTKKKTPQQKKKTNSPKSNAKNTNNNRKNRKKYQLNTNHCKWTPVSHVPTKTEPNTRMRTHSPVPTTTTTTTKQQAIPINLQAAHCPRLHCLPPPPLYCCSCCCWRRALLKLCLRPRPAPASASRTLEDLPMSEPIQIGANQCFFVFFLYST